MRPSTIRAVAALILNFLPASLMADTPPEASGQVKVALVLSKSASPGGSAETLWRESSSRLAKDGIFLFIDERRFQEDETLRELEPGTPEWKAHDPYATLRDHHGATVLVLADAASGGALALESASRGLQAPFWTVQLALDAAREASLELGWSPAASFLAHSGLYMTAEALMPWLREGMAALLVRIPPEGVGPESFVSFLEAVGSYHGESDRRSDDVNYVALPFLRTPLGDTALTVLTLSLFAALCVILSLMPSHRRLAGPSTPGARGLSLPALESVLSFIMAALSFGFSSFAGRAIVSILGVGIQAVGAFPRAALVTLAIMRLCAFLSLYYAISGFMERAGLLPHATRTMGAKASALSFAVVGVAALVRFPTGAPFALACSLAAAAAGLTGLGSGLFLGAAVAFGAFIAAPFFLGQYPELSVAFLYGDAAAILVQAFVVAPFALWLGASVSPRARMKRGASAAPLFVLGFPLALIAEALLVGLL